MFDLSRCRAPSRKIWRPLCRPVIRRVWRPGHRRVRRACLRPLMPYRGPSFNSIVALFHRYCRMAEQYRKRWYPSPCKSRFQTLVTPEQADRQFRQDLERVYGEKPAPGRGPPPIAAPVLAPAAPAKAPPAWPPPEDKRDVTPVPIRGAIPLSQSNRS